VIICESRIPKMLAEKPELLPHYPQNTSCEIDGIDCGIKSGPLLGKN
jgi:hypothetical protein